MPRTIGRATLAVLLAGSCLGASPGFAGAETINFVVARPIEYQLGVGDSYILSLSDPDDIATARRLAEGREFLIVFAFVAKGSDGINRDVLAPGKPLWSWHVAEFLGFNSAGIELCDGTPTFTEQESQNWSSGELVEICYWSYTVVDELGPMAADGSTFGRVKASYRGGRLAPER